MSSINSITLLFPGQGSQYVGMGKNLFDQGHTEAFNSANQALGFSLTDLMFQGDEEKLKQTEITQPALITHSLAIWNILKNILTKNQIAVARVLGHSVGEYAALAVAQSFTLEQAVKAVHYRGKFMQAAVPSGIGKMYAVLKVPEEVIRQACDAVSTLESKVMPANFNDPNQIVISGHAEACDKAVAWLKHEYQAVFKAIELKVSAPFHSSLMLPASQKMTPFLDETNIKPNQFPYIANIDAKEYANGTKPQQIKDNLIKQIAGSVLWTQSIQKLPSNTVCLEVGPGKVLAGLVKKINPEIKVISTDLKLSDDVSGSLEALLKMELNL